MWAILLPPIIWLLLYYAYTRLRSSSTASARHDSSHFSMSWHGTATYSTSALNHLLHRTAQRHHHLLHFLYLPSIPTALLALPLSVALLVYNLLRIAHTHLLLPLLSLAWGGAAADGGAGLAETNLLSIAVPGLTLPLESVGYLWLAVLVSVVVHEAGHALCACVEKVRVRSVGLMWLVLFPAAYVETEELEDEDDDGEEQTADDESESEDERGDEDEDEDKDSQQAELTTRAPAITAVQKLKIVSAGIYHNLLLTAAALALLAALPMLLSSAYRSTGSGATVLSVDERVSPALAASSVLVSGSRIVRVNQWAVGGVSEWQDVLVHRTHQQQAPTHDGWCVSAAMVADTSKVQQRQGGKWMTAKGDDSWSQLAQQVSATLQADRAAQPSSPPQPAVSTASLAAPLPASMRQAAVQMEHSDKPLVPAHNNNYDSDMLAFSCCIPELAHLSPLVCFTHNFATNSTPPSSPSSSSSSSLCLQPRGLISASTPPCSATAACPSSTAEPSTCVSPQLAGSQRLLVLVVESADGGSRDEVRFVGRVEEVLRAVECTGYATRGWLRFLLILTPFLQSLALHWPVLCTRALQFIVAVSTSLLVLNALPIPYADGQQFVRLLSSVARGKRRLVGSGGGGGWYGGLLRRMLCVLPVWWWDERQVEWRVRMVSVLFVVNVAMSVLPMFATIGSSLIHY